jgi:hypothetical protein
MIGWIIVFALLALLGAIPALVGGGPVEIPVASAGALFAFLFLLTVVARFVRQKA